MGLTYDEIIEKICLNVDKHYKNLCKQENELAMKLQEIRMVNKHHPKNPPANPQKEWRDRNREHVELLRQIGNIHREMGNFKNPIEFVKAIAIYECALVHCQDIDDEKDATSDINNVIMKDEAVKLQREKRQALDDFFQQCTEKDTPMPEEYFEDDLANKERLEDIRHQLKQKILSVDGQPDLYNCYEPGLDKEKQERREVARIRKNGEIFVWIQNKMKGFMATLITQCQDLLNFHKTDFAFIAFGSLSRKETTPYSDVEFGAVQNSDNLDMDPMYRKCLEHLLMTLHLKLLSFGETVLPAMDIASLNESDLNDPTKDWYLDFRKYTKTKQGISFDGLMPRANKTPYFTYSTYPEDIQFRLTNTKAAFMKQFKTIETDATMKRFLFVFKGDFTTLFGDESIETELKKCFTENSEQRTMVLKLIKKELNEDFVKHSCIKKIYDAKYKKEIIEKDSFHVKKELYRLPSVVINNLLHLLKSNTTCVWEIIKFSGVSEDNTHHLKMTLSTAAELRLRCYAQNNGQVDEDKGHFLPDILVGNGIDKESFSKQLILRYFLTAIPLLNIMEEARPEEDDVLSSLGNLRTDDVEEEGKHVLRSLKDANLYEASDLNKAMAFILMNDTRAAKECMKKANELSSKINSSPTQMIMYILCNTYIKDDVISKPFFDRLKKQAREPDKLDISVKNTLGNALIQKGEVKEATEVLEKTKDESKDKRKITSITLLKVAYEKEGNEGKLQEIHDEHPEIDVIESLMNKISDSKENEILVERTMRESQQLKKDLSEAQGVITALKRESEEAEKKIAELTDNIMKMKRSENEVSPGHLDAITSYIRSLSRQYSEQE